MAAIEDRYISLLTDFGFKRIFGTAPNKDLLINFLNCLFAYGECGIEEGTVFKELLIGVLHLDDKLLAILVFAINVEDCLAGRLYLAKMLAV